jgi:tetratricopeptide (TPR) repeat protein
LTPYGLLTSNDRACDPPPTVAQLRRTVASAKRKYQACQYASVLNELPRLLHAARRACAASTGNDRHQAYGLAADAYQVAGSVLLKLGDGALAALAADRSMDAAERSEDPVVLAASARIVTHSLMSGGHPGRACEVAIGAAEHLDREVPKPSAEAISVYGALLLRAAIAAAKADNRATATQLLDEAADAGARLGRDDNAHWTGFGPTNVALHRVNVAVALGDAGTAVSIARQIDVHRIQLAERRAALFLDTAEAYTQWGKHELAYDALRTAEHIAPEEVRTRPAVHALIGDLTARAPRSMRTKMIGFAERIGVEV